VFAVAFGNCSISRLTSREARLKCVSELGGNEPCCGEGFLKFYNFLRFFLPVLFSLPQSQRKPECFSFFYRGRISFAALHRKLKGDSQNANT
jgi:hypothetical protein